MSKLKSDIIQKIYKDNFFCKKGHNIFWTGIKYVHQNDLKCDKCGTENTSATPIRWSCAECNALFCSLCYKLIIDKFCPKKHKLKYFKQTSVDYFSTYTCDNCFQKFGTKDGMLYDKDCNFTICPLCYYDSNDVPEILED